jgi:hypothetical protein
MAAPPFRWLQAPPREDSAAVLRAAGELLPCGRPDDDPVGEAHPAPPDQPIGCGFAGADLLLAFPRAAVLVARDSGAIKAVHVLPAGLTLLAVDDAGRRALWLGNGRLAVLDLETGAWANDRVPGFIYAAVIEVQEQAYLVNADEGWIAPLTELADYVARAVTSADNRHVWVADKEESGGVFATTTARLLWDAEREDEGDETGVLDGDGRWHPYRDGEADEHFAHADEVDVPWALQPGSAVAVAPDDHIRIFDAGVVHVGQSAWFRVGFPVGAARFDVAGNALLLASRAAVRVVSVARRPRMERSFALAALAPALVDPRAPLPAALTAEPPARPARR